MTDAKWFCGHPVAKDPAIKVCEICEYDNKLTLEQLQKAATSVNEKSMEDLIKADENRSLAEWRARSTPAQIAKWGRFAQFQ